MRFATALAAERKPPSLFVSGPRYVSDLGPRLPALIAPAIGTRCTRVPRSTRGTRSPAPEVSADLALLAEGRSRSLPPSHAGASLEALGPGLAPAHPQSWTGLERNRPLLRAAPS